jgi:multidrug efflux pump subunit AcrA (membrane-fusion protein)
MWSIPYARSDQTTMKRQRICGALLLAALVLGGCSQPAGGGRGGRGRPGGRGLPSPNPVPTVAAQRKTVRATSTISGVIAPLQNVAISSSLSEPADEVRVSEGDHVSVGRVLAVLDTADLRAQLAQAQSTVETDIRTAISSDAKVVQTQYQARLNIGTGVDQVNSARAALASARQTLTNDSANLMRDRALLSGGYVAQQTVDQQATLVRNDQDAVRTAQANLQTAVTNQQVNGSGTTGLQAANVASAAADARASEATIGEARALVAQYQATIVKARIVSPVDGVIVNRNLNPGEYPGSRTIFTVQELDKVYAELNASSSDTFSIPIGAPVTVSVAGNGAHPYTGRVVAVLGQVAPGSTDFTVKVLLANADGKLQSGLPVTAVAALPPVSGVGIPSSAFLDDTHTTVMAATDQGNGAVARTVHVKELGTDGTTSIVSGLRMGQVVVANGQLGIADGQSLAKN